MTRRVVTADDAAGIGQRKSAVQMNPVFRGRNFSVNNSSCFVLMPFSERLKPVYEDHIKKVVVSLGLECQRADDIFLNREIIEDIWESINQARILIADLTGKNPNVFYEVGVAHTVGKSVILITQRIEDVPFDLRHLRHIQYKFTPKGMGAFEDRLKSTILNILNRSAR